MTLYSVHASCGHTNVRREFDTMTSAVLFTIFMQNQGWEVDDIEPVYKPAPTGDVNAEGMVI